MAWDVAQYQRFRDERARPFHDLVAHVPDRPVALAVDLGCGTGEPTRLLAERWPGARVLGVDNSPPMLAAAAARAIPGRLDFAEADAVLWQPERPVDLIVANAVLHWLPDHDRLLERLAAALAPGGTLAVQMPANHDAPSHLLLDETLAEMSLPPRPANPVRLPAWYAEKLLGLGFSADVWSTVYLHVLPGDDAVLEWVKGTTLIPVLDGLAPADRADLLAGYAARLRTAYPRGPHGTLFPFRRIFFVATLW